MKVAITGVSSKLASDIVPLLEKDDEISEILGIDLVKPSFNSSKIIFKKRDVRDKQISEDLKGYDAIIHLAFIVLSIKSEMEAYSININGSKNIFDCAIKAGVKRIVHASSVAAYGAFPENPVPMTEECPIRIMKNTFYYNETKYRVEKILDKIEKENPDVKISRLRPHIFLSPLEDNALGGRITEKNVYGFYPGMLWQYVWAEDVAQAFYLALKKGAHGAFNLGADNPISSSEIATRLNKRLKIFPYTIIHSLVSLTHALRLQYQLDPGWLRIARYPIIVDSSKAKEILGWRPKYDTLGAIKAYIAHQKD